MLGEISRVLSTLAERPLFPSTTGFHFVCSCCHHYPTSRKEKRGNGGKEDFFFFSRCHLCVAHIPLLSIQLRLWALNHKRNSEIFFVFKLFWLKVKERGRSLVGEWMGSEEWWAVSSPLATQLLMHTVSHIFLLKVVQSSILHKVHHL